MFLCVCVCVCVFDGDFSYITVWVNSKYFYIERDWNRVVCKVAIFYYKTLFYCEYDIELNNEWCIRCR